MLAVYLLSYLMSVQQLVQQMCNRWAGRVPSRPNSDPAPERQSGVSHPPQFFAWGRAFCRYSVPEIATPPASPCAWEIQAANPVKPVDVSEKPYAHGTGASGAGGGVPPSPRLLGYQRHADSSRWVHFHMMRNSTRVNRASPHNGADRGWHRVPPPVEPR